MAETAGGGSAVHRHKLTIAGGLTRLFSLPPSFLISHTSPPPLSVNAVLSRVSKCMRSAHTHTHPTTHTQFRVHSSPVQSVTTSIQFSHTHFRKIPSKNGSLCRQILHPAASTHFSTPGLSSKRLSFRLAACVLIFNQ